MSSIEEPKTENKSARRRRPAGSGSSRRRPTTSRTEGETSEEPRIRRERPASIPVPAELFGKSSVGLIDAIIRRGRLKFGFISVGSEEKSENEIPRIYFSFDNVADPAVTLRRTYPVEFTILSDEKGRAYATGIKLTANGKVVAEAKEAALAQERAERGDQPVVKRERAPRPPRESREPRERRERKPVEERLVVLTVTCEGKSEAKSIEFNAAQSIGKLKNIACTAFDAPVTYNVFHVTKENPAGEFLTRTVLNSISSGESIRLAEPVAAEAK